MSCEPRIVNLPGANEQFEHDDQRESVVSFSKCKRYPGKSEVIQVDKVNK